MGFALWSVIVTVLLIGATPAAAETAEELYNKARSEYRSALGIEEKDRKVEALRRCIQQLEEVEKSDTQGNFAAKRLYLVGQCHHLIYDVAKNRDDRNAALEHYQLVVENYPESPLADDAQYLKGIALMPEDPSRALVEFKKVSLFFPGGDSKPKAVQMAAQLERQLGCKDNPKKAAASALPQVAISSPSTGEPGSQTPPSRPSKSGGVKAQAAAKTGSSAEKTGTKCPAIAELQNIQHWSGEDYTRVAIYTNTPVAFQEQAFLQDAKRQKPAQILVDLKGCVLNPHLGTIQKISDAFLEGINAVQLDANKARIVLDARTLDRYRIFTLSDPFRIIVDIQGKKPAQQADVPSPPKVRPETDRLPSLARQLGLDVNRIVLDPGHGGKDKGATGPGGVHEKNITLAVAQELKGVLEEKLNCQVLLTRTKDRFVTLEERTGFANANKADLFLSIHTNAHADHNLTGTETYFLNFSKDKESARVAALENATSAKRIGDLETILQDLMRNTKIKESAQLASAVQRQVVKQIRAKEQERVRDLGVKQAPFCVLIGAEMPCILIETAFITNPREEARLKDKEFQKELAKGIATGVEFYMRQMKSLAHAGDRP
jgi:N-acetylmuramoyl-L-alanine amidase